MTDRIAEFHACCAEKDQLIKLFVRWWFDDEVDNAWFFNEAVRACPELNEAVKAELSRKGSA